MYDTPLIGPYSSDDVLAREPDGSRTARQFLSDVVRLAESLPDRLTVINLTTSRYEFLVGFAAAILRRQVTLLPQSRAVQTLRRIAGDYPESYALTDRDDRVEGIESVAIQPLKGLAPWPGEIPLVPLNQVVAIAFTSGSTGQPMPNKKTWGALTAVAYATGSRLGITGGDRASVVATVPHQHMFGLEASVMLPIMHGLVMHAGRPLFPADILSALADVEGRRILVTTPLHLRACVTEGVRMPPVGLILSATAPLSQGLAQEAERHFHTEVHEIFGFAEAGSVAERRTTAGNSWRPLEGVRLQSSEMGWTVQTDYLPVPVRVPDRIAVDAQGLFVLHGREADQINVAGHRVSLGDLNQKLLEIEGVQDGVFYLPEEGSDFVTRLMAFVVAPGKTSEEIQRALRTHIDPVFLPRPLVCVPSLPRNATGKLPYESVHELARQWLQVRATVHERVLSISHDHPSLAGHFPGYPVVPGVVLLNEVLETLRRGSATSLVVKGLPTVKFSSPLRPGEVVTIRVDEEGAGQAIFSCRVAARLVASGTIEFGPGAAAHMERT